MNSKWAKVKHKMDGKITVDEMTNSWDLYNLCKEYVEKNSTDWQKRKEKRENEKKE